MTRLAVVTGGTRGIGKAICLDLKKQGYKVVANYFANKAAADKLEKECGIQCFSWDVSDFESCRKGLELVSKELKEPIAILVNNAGITADVMMHKSELPQWHNVINTNLNSCYNMCRLVINDMRDAKYGRIVNISSINALTGELGQTNYAASKAGIIGLTKALALENARNNITVNAVAPGYINTDMTAVIRDDIKEKIIANIPTKRMGEPEEVARCVTFLVDEKSGFITGVTLSVNGGQLMH